MARISTDRFDQIFSKRESAMDWIVFLTNDNETDREIIQPDHLKRAVRFISPTDYEEEILIERNLSDLCGYPICLEEPKRYNAMSPLRRSPQNAAGVSPSWTVSENHQLGEPRFCSRECQARSDYYLNSILKNPSYRSQNKNHYSHSTNSDEKSDHKILLLEELDQINNRPTIHSSPSADQPEIDLLDKNHASQHQGPKTEPQHNFLEPLLTQFQALNTSKWVDKNLNPIFSSIQIIEHPPQASISASGTSIPIIEPHPSNNKDPDQRFFDSFTRKSLALNKPPQDLNPIHELSSSLTEALTSQAIQSNSNPHRSLATKPCSQAKIDDQDLTPVASEAKSPTAGLLEAEIIYNVSSVEEQSAIDQAMALRDQLGLQPT
ncbi:hypothetical protein MJO29_002631 [Puccinia striiformis f. sp. tritici]|nr:hypothetical protein MJO29_002631 [Puccinia striiformis f. sp. tritici]